MEQDFVICIREDLSVSTQELIPHGEKIRNAVRWISEMSKEQPEKKIKEIIFEAEQRFDLSPKDCDFLYRKFVCKDE
jgi:hypothetical protein